MEKHLIVLLVVTFCLWLVHAWIGQFRFAWLDVPRWRYGAWCYVLFVKGIGVAGGIGGFMSFVLSVIVLADYGWPWYGATLGAGGLVTAIVMVQWQCMKLASPVAGWFSDMETSDDQQS